MLLLDEEARDNENRITIIPKEEEVWIQDRNMKRRKFPVTQKEFSNSNRWNMDKHLNNCKRKRLFLFRVRKSSDHFAALKHFPSKWPTGWNVTCHIFSRLVNFITWFASYNTPWLLKSSNKLNFKIPWHIHWFPIRIVLLWINTHFCWRRVGWVFYGMSTFGGLFNANISQMIIWFQVTIHKKRTCRIVDFDVPADNRVKLKESKKRVKYRDFARELANDSDTSCNRSTRYSHQRISKGTGRLGNKMTSGDHANYSLIYIGQNTGKGPGDLLPLKL